VNLVDVVLLVIVVGTAIHGYRIGTVAQVFALVGLAIGLVGGALLAPHLAGFVTSPTAKALATLGSVFVPAAVGLGLGQAVGARASHHVRQTHLGRLDSVAGAVVAAAATLLTAWLIASVLATAPVRSLAAQIQRSAVLRHLDAILPPAPSVFSRVQRLIDVAGLPQAFAQFEPLAAAPLPLPLPPLVQAAVARAGESTVQVSGGACDLMLYGSGFVAAPDLVITNAHVVAGVSDVIVTDHHGAHRATPVFFDPNLDLAVLRVSGLTEAPLHLLATSAARGTDGAVLGYPGGGPFDAEAAVILARIPAIGRNIYGQGLTDRSVYEVESLVRPGNSGGPLVTPDGTVVGVVFSRSVVRNNIGYALTSDSLTQDLATAESLSAAVSTGPCTAG
jgi:S1-C subfamily serine protease